MEHPKTMIRKWIDSAKYIHVECIGLQNALHSFPSWTLYQHEVIKDLSSACIRATESCYMLIENERLWDADIIYRSAVEATFKFAFLLLDKTEFNNSFSEFSEDLFYIGEIRNHRKAQDFLRHIPENTAIQNLLLPPEVLQDYLKKFPSKRRRALEGKWGLTGLVNEITKSDHIISQGLGPILHGYNVSSHVLHADCMGNAIIREREERTEARRQAVHLAHAARIISDLLHLFFIRLWISYQFIDAENQPIINCYNSFAFLEEELSKAQQNFYFVEYGHPVDQNQSEHEQ